MNDIKDLIKYCIDNPVPHRPPYNNLLLLKKVESVDCSISVYYGSYGIYYEFYNNSYASNFHLIICLYKQHIKTSIINSGLFYYGIDDFVEIDQTKYDYSEEMEFSAGTVLNSLNYEYYKLSKSLFHEGIKNSISYSSDNNIDINQFYILYDSLLQD